MTSRERLPSWFGVDPDRLEAVSVSLGDDALTARGSSVTGDYVLTYELETGPGWITRHLAVRATGAGWWRSLLLRRDPGGSWYGKADGQGVDIPGDLHDPAWLRGATDCDLALCPLTNTMPVLRHGLLDAARRGERATAAITAAWVSVPGLTVHASPQRYTAGTATPDGGALIGFVSGDFTATIRFDRDGLVADYPGIGHRTTGGPAHRETEPAAGR
ncbi:hypothetical protein Misp01_26880 [Microtetraspora sp. NBRC 13810]|uniref:putative glycolipid-binding domain-containing protein n=1 Tax=Microtetraspora sp. NBRC 13810 TaxID=3030990 RepID=UPI0024A0CEC2|nr:putative glycolipid-binding domain-containing protein [Microtetraspora sp. NBRC 13810]GLW07558.1 hypothetical protein Misp01_26880 [Microtetraspora sp. NBRC 13810]